MLRSWIDRLALLLPSRCEVCHAWPARPVCASCEDRFTAPAHRCARCALRLPPGAAVCGACLREPPAFDACHAAVDYAYPWSTLLARFKFGGEPQWAAPLARLMRRQPALAHALDTADLVLPLPLGPGRLAERGFNQALQLARHLAPAKVNARTLLRVQETPPQSALHRADRLRNVAQAFALDPMRPGAVQGQRVVLVDDVMTSGATLEAAARVLQAAGARQVTAVVLARTPPPSP